MAITFLTLSQLENEQAKAEGYQQGPEPSLNNQNVNTQASEGNSVTPSPSPVPYYPGATETPNLNLALTNMSVNIAENFVILDAVPEVVPIVQAVLQNAITTTPASITLTASVTSIYNVSLYMESVGTGSGGTTVLATLIWTSTIGSHTIVTSLPLDSAQVVMETFPIMVLAGQTISLATSFSGAAASYAISARITLMPASVPVVI